MREMKQLQWTGHDPIITLCLQMTRSLKFSAVTSHLAAVAWVTWISGEPCKLLQLAAHDFKGCRGDLCVTCFCLSAAESPKSRLTSNCIVYLIPTLLPRSLTCIRPDLIFLTSSLGHVPFPFISSTFFSHVKTPPFLSRTPSPPVPYTTPQPPEKTAALHSSWLSWRPEQNRPCNRTAQDCTLFTVLHAA